MKLNLVTCSPFQMFSNGDIYSTYNVSPSSIVQSRNNRRLFKNDFRHLDQQVSIPLPGSLFDQKYKLSNLRNGGAKSEMDKSMLLNYNKKVYGTQFVPILKGNNILNKRKKRKKMAIIKSNREFDPNVRQMRTLLNYQTGNPSSQPPLRNVNKNKDSLSNSDNWIPRQKLQKTTEESKLLSDGRINMSTGTRFNLPDLINFR